MGVRKEEEEQTCDVSPSFTCCELTKRHSSSHSSMTYDGTARLRPRRRPVAGGYRARAPQCKTTCLVIQNPNLGAKGLDVDRAREVHARGFGCVPSRTSSSPRLRCAGPYPAVLLFCSKLHKSNVPWLRQFLSLSIVDLIAHFLRCAVRDTQSARGPGRCLLGSMPLCLAGYRSHARVSGQLKSLRHYALVATCW